jgi:hypothetical protein
VPKPRCSAPWRGDTGRTEAEAEIGQDGPRLRAHCGAGRQRCPMGLGLFQFVNYGTDEPLQFGTTHRLRIKETALTKGCPEHLDKLKFLDRSIVLGFDRLEYLIGRGFVRCHQLRSCD